MALNIKEAMVQSEDPANKEILGHVVPRSIRMMLFTTTVNAQEAADRIIKSIAYPLAQLTFVANRNIFRMEVGDQFKYSSSEYGITDMVFRIITITEQDLRKEHIKVYAIEDVEYMSSSSIFSSIPVGTAPGGSTGLVYTLEHVLLVEAPYVLSGNDIMLIPIAAKVTGQELGFALYMSTDGSSYTLVQNITTFAVYGQLASNYPANTYEIDDDIGFQVDITLSASVLQSVSRQYLFGPTNLSLLGNHNENVELITWQTITPVSGYNDRYEITGVYRNRYGTDKKAHYVGEPFWFVGYSVTTVAHLEFTVGSTRFFKLLPYSGSSSSALQDANAYSINFVGMARRPYDPTNYACNGVLVTPPYSADCVLTWSPRVRGDGAGLGNPDYVTQSPVTWEGLFEIEVWVSGSKVRTISGIDAITYTYTSGMNSGDNGGLPSQVTFKLKNYLTYGGDVYSSAWISLTAIKE